MKPKHLFPILLGTLPAHAALIPALNPNGRTIHAQTETAGNFISLADLQAVIDERADLTTAAVLSGEAADGTSATTIAEELANGGSPALFTFSGPNRYSRNDAAVALAATSGGRFGLIAETNTWTLGSTIPQGVSHFGAIFYSYLPSSNLVSVRANFSNGTFTTYAATATDLQYTFVGFAAPEGATIISIQVTEASGGGWLGFDDVAIVLAEPGAPIASWTGEGDDDNWSSGENWQSGNPPAPRELLSFGPSANELPFNDLAAGIGYGGLQFLANAPAYEIDGNAISPGPSLINLSGNHQAFLLPLELDAGFLVSNSGGAVYFDGPVSGPHSVSKSGTGLLQLTAANTYSGGLAVNQGLVELVNDQTGADGGFSVSNQSNSTLVILAEGTAAVADGKEILLGTTAAVGTAAAAFNVAGSLDNSGTLNVLRGSTMNVTGTVDQSGPALVQGIGGYGATLNINSGGVFTYLAEQPFILRSGTNDAGRGRINLSGGEFITAQPFDHDGVSEFTPRLTLSSGGTLRLSAPVATLADDIEILLGSGGGYIDTDGHDTAIAAVISGDGALTKEGAGTLTLSAANTYTGGTFVDEGTLVATTPAAFADDSAVTVAGGAILRLDFEGSDIVAALTLGVDALDPGTYDAGTHPAFITGSGSIVVANPDPFIDWIASFPSITEPADLEKSADPDKDGLSNLLEFALDGDPSAGAAAGKVVSAIHEGHLTLTLPVRAGATFTGSGPLTSDPIDGLVYVIEGSGNLSTFDAGVEALLSALSDGLPDLSTGWEYRSFRLATPISDAAGGFLRTDVSDANP